MPLTPTIWRIAREARNTGAGAGAMLERVQDHARAYGNRLEFRDAVELVLFYEVGDREAAR